MEELLDKIKDYLNTRIRLSKLTLIEKGVLLFANLLTNGVVIVFIILGFLFVSLAMGFYISDLLGNSFGGFFIVSLFYFVLAVLIYSLKDKYIEKPIINGMIKKILKEDNEESTK